ncbi:MAG: acyl-CoA desaturase, partial [Propionibacteriales bacterium]|nr:acyl-CoA desaturase [Propionibacteriales bacterium]
MTITETRPITSARLSSDDVAEIGRRLDAIRNGVLTSRGAADAAYIHKVIRTQRILEMGSRAVLLFSILPPAWLIGTAGLTVAKILENMEIGHNILHGQWDWMRDPKIHSTTWEWDATSPAAQWKASHNEEHHRFTNVVGKDNDLGYGIMRVSADQPWSLPLLGQPLYNLVNAIFFEYGIAAYDLQLGPYLKGEVDREKFRTEAAAVLIKLRKQLIKDFVVHPVLSGPSLVTTLAANAVANVVRNLWTHSVIICGHFPAGVETFEATEVPADETRGEWYVRQMLGSANISGSPLIHMMTGNLSHQIEHHLFPDLPSNRYAEIAPQVRKVFDDFDLKYVTGPLPKQVASAWWKVITMALPNPEPDRSRPAIVADEAR